jgi:hypothetical protein
MDYSGQSSILEEVTMQIPSPASQIQFLTNLQRLLDEGIFTASYKYALLMSLAHISVESVNPDAAQIIHVQEIARKFIEYYWRQAAPYFGKETSMAQMLHQNRDRTKGAKIVSLVAEMRQQSDGSLASARQNTKLWESYVRKVAHVVRVMPLHKLQMIGRSRFEFLYTVPEPEKFPGYIQLNPGVAYNFRRFYGLVRALIQEAWTNYIRKLEGNQPILGQVTDLEEFLFGSERADLGKMRQILVPFQEGRCFYCEGRFVGEKADVDHFIPWMRYASDLGHNFVVAHASCNNNKRELLAGIPHLKRWVQRNTERGEGLESYFREQGVLHDLSVSDQIARWAYDQAEVAGAKVWIKREQIVALDSAWRAILKNN